MNISPNTGAELFISSEMANSIESFVYISPSCNPVVKLLNIYIGVMFTELDNMSCLSMELEFMFFECIDNKIIEIIKICNFIKFEYNNVKIF